MKHSKAPSQKVALPSIVAALATVAAAVAHKHPVNREALTLAALTVVQFVIGYLAPAKPVKKPRRKHPRPPVPRFITVYDGVRLRVKLASTSTDAVMGYVDGIFRNIGEVAHDYPRHRHFTIAVRAEDDADFLDIETGDARPDQAPAWCARQHRRGARIVGLYANGSTWPAVFAALDHAKIDKRLIVKWLADPTGHPHIPAGFDGCQWLFHGDYDESIFFADKLR